MRSIRALAHAQIADAPKVHQTQHVQGLEELEDTKLQRLKAAIANRMRTGDGAAHAPDADFGLLLGALLPEHMVVEDEGVWEEGTLLIAVASDMQQECEERTAQLGIV